MEDRKTERLPQWRVRGREGRGAVPRLLLVIIWLVSTAVVGADSQGDDNGPTRRKVLRYQSRHLVVHCDCEQSEVRELANRLDSTVRFASRYWSRPLRGRIECYVVNDLRNWSSADLPADHAKVLLEQVGGFAYAIPKQQKRHVFRQAHVFATMEPGIAEHELVHAYCLQAFGCGGPDWYKEGMAELMSFQRLPASGVRCRERMLRFLRQSPPLTATSVATNTRFTDPIVESFMRIPGLTEDAAREANLVAHDLWAEGNDEIVRTARESYCRSWALCHFLTHNPNYRDRFRMLGKSYLRNHPTVFHDFFGPVMSELEFEYRQFLKNLVRHYRVDLCHWDWTADFAALDEDSAKTTRVRAAGGYQPAGILVRQGEGLAVNAPGTWGLDRVGTLSDAGGNVGGHGGLEAVVLSDFKLSAPVALGCDGVFTLPHSGRLYLRCRDAWNDLSNNQGEIVVTLRRVAADSSLTP